MLLDADDLDLSGSGSGSENEDKSEDNAWDAPAAVPTKKEEPVFESWEDAPDYEELERQKKEAEERAAREKQEAIEAEKRRKEEKKAFREAAKARLMESSSDDEGGLFDIEAAHEQEKHQDFAVAMDMLGATNEKVTVDDYMNFVPRVVSDFNGLRQKLVEVLKQKVDFKSKEAPQLLAYFIRCLIDDYKGEQMKTLDSELIKIINEKLQQTRAKQGKNTKKKTSTKVYMNIKDDGKDNDDDFM
ncbi:hypothetical protein TVAG_076340 [Trichomonas vaginalis G3]|uniref:Eukaryotic translation initiation factor 3 subunit J n=1 Tax=Trichomonas vaginalis (strain ATCC PRA-98 / G3) TaxID=412133 RepID=A2D9N1_TRIV3|nr:translation initiation factor eIF3 subunit family [Trichomonas vaginalis G3]EAY22887.1 hypothetical protein TVAG_076340 [Trichomonas vaginalis G3]KAI5527397.1 translation initiation factor eIF3 subunit family [Trichomonas vaginalis G3]|eukprot:XP_001583873.1 hypothetical protein [Trichomonas vaginalis G3]